MKAFGTLLKYEMRKTRKMKLSILLLTVLAELCYLIGLPNMEESPFFPIGIIGLFLLGSFGIFLCSLQSIDVLYRELNSRQSYMLFMTPNSSYRILGAKVVENGLSIFLSVLFFGVLAIVDVLLLLLREGMRMDGFLEGLRQAMQLLGQSELSLWNVLGVILLILGAWLNMMTLACFSVTLQGSFLHGRRFGWLWSFLIFILANTLLGMLVANIAPLAGIYYEPILGFVIYLLGTLGFYALTAYLLDHYMSF